MAALPGAKVKDYSLEVSIEDGTRGLLKGSARLISHNNVFLVFAEEV
jgi:hypothetical protein